RPVVVHVGIYSQHPRSRCHGLAPWWFTLASTASIHAVDATGSPRGGSRWYLQPASTQSMPRARPVVVHVGIYSQHPRSRCHGVAPWWFTLVSTASIHAVDATGSPRGGSRWHLQPASTQSMPRARPVVVHVGIYSQHPRSRCHGLAPWWFTLVSTASIHAVDATG